ncbi:MAG: tetratricopeptide repeat protein [Planctomycetota bacterium]|nr:tetratricopeptide repeat protein [Planctomycetota bacterium]
MSETPSPIDTRLDALVARPSDRWVRTCIALIVLAAVGAYFNSFLGAFVFDDEPSILGNPTLHRLWPLSAPLSPPTTSSSYGRPLLNLSLAVNYALSGLNPFSYHAVNLCIHILAALTLFGIIRRTLQRPALAGRFGPAAVPLAGAIGLLWAVHPLQTMAVTYIVQRAESLAGLFFLLTIYALLRGATGGRAWVWYATAWAACLAAAFTKETMAPLPVVALLYDRTFLAGSFRGAIRRRWGLYLLLAACWAPLAWLIHSAGGRHDTAGFGIGVTAWQYALTEPGVILHYLRLAFWPDVLVLDYGWPLAAWPAAAFPAAVILVMLAATLWALWRKPALGFLAAWFFLTLAVTSSVVPIKDPAFEQRMYLALAGVVVLVVVGAWVLLRALPVRLPAAVPIAAAALVAMALAARTHARNNDYRTGEAIWRSALASRPENARAHNNLGNILRGQGRFEEAVEQYQAAVRIRPDYAKAWYNCAAALTDMKDPKRYSEAVACCRKAVEIDPNLAEAHNNWGNALLEMRDFSGAIEQYRQALRIDPELAEAHNNWGNALQDQWKFDLAISQYQEALRIRPDYVEARFNWGGTLMKNGQYREAAEQFRNALRLRPEFAPAVEGLRQAEERLEKNGEPGKP